MKRRLISISIAVVASGLGIFWLAQFDDAISSGNFDRIQRNMSQSEVEYILCGPGEAGYGDTPHGFPLYWQGRGRNTIIVHFTCRREGDTIVNVVASKQWWKPSLWDRLMEWWGGYELTPGGGRLQTIKGA